MINLKIDRIDVVTDKIRLFGLVSASGGALAGYTAGAHIDFDLGEVGSRSYSLIDFEPAGETPTTYHVAVQCENDGQGGSKAMHDLALGDTISTTPPKNDFALHQSDAPALLIAGGIGVTPIISFATELTARGTAFAFHYAVRSIAFCAFKDKLKALFGGNLTLWFDDQKMIDIEGVIQAAAENAHIYCCGPKGMIDAVRGQAETAGFSNDQIHFELFASPESQDGERPFEVELADGRVFTIPADMSIIEVLEENGVDVMFDCSRGDCGVCRTDVVSGTPDHRDVALSEAERASGKVMQICVSRAKSERLVLDI